MLQYFVGEMLESLGVTAMLHATREFDHASAVLVVGRIIAQKLAVIQAQTFDQQVPESRVLEISLLVSVEAWQAEFFAEEFILFEPDPQHGEIVIDFELCDMKAFTTGIVWQVGEIMDNLALAGGRAAGEDDGVEGSFAHND